MVVLQGLTACKLLRTVFCLYFLIFSSLFSSIYPSNSGSLLLSCFASCSWSNSPCCGWSNGTKSGVSERFGPLQPATASWIMSAQDQRDSSGSLDWGYRLQSLNWNHVWFIFHFLELYCFSFGLRVPKRKNKNCKKKYKEFSCLWSFWLVHLEIKAS